jgi:hypothetical protein
MARRGRVSRLLTLPLGEVSDLVVAQIGLLTALWILKVRSRGKLLHPLGSSQPTAADIDEQAVERMATAFDRVARFGLFRPTCLVRAIALERYLRDAGPRASVRVGVLRDGDRLLAHAWIEMGNRIVGDEPSHVRRFTPLHDFTALPR